jgi:hypothetical protein
VIGYIVGESISIVMFPRICCFAMADLREQHVCIKFCFKLGKTAAEPHQNVNQAFGDNSLGQVQTFEWYNRFKMTEYRLMMTIVRDGRQLASHQKM